MTQLEQQTAELRKPDLKRRLTSTIGYASAALGTLAVFRTFGPLSDINQWLANVYRAYDAYTFSLRDLATSAGSELAAFHVNVLIISLLVGGTCLRAIVAVKPEAAIKVVRLAAKSARHGAPFFLGIAVGMTVVRSNDIGWFGALAQILYETVVALIFAVPLSLAVASIVICALAIVFARSPQNDPDLFEPGPGFHRFLITEGLVVLLIAGAIFVFGTQAFFDFG